VSEPDPQPHSELASFGEELRREREIRGISLKEIADATKISKRFLEAIESNDHKTLPAPVFTRGFVREYARYLGLNSEDMVNRYNYAAAGDDRIEKNAHLERLVAPRTEALPAPRPKKGIPPPYARIDRNIYILLFVIAALGAAIWFAVSHKRQAQEQASKPVAAPALSNSAAKPIAQTSTAPASAAAAQDETLHLVLTLTGDSVVKLYADGQKVFDGEMRRGDHHTFDAKSEFRFATIGNAGGVGATLNGVAIPPFGREGQVRHDKLLNRETLREVPADAERSRP
jgi:hypothetical protein